MKPPEDVKLSREEGEALIERVKANQLTGEDRHLVVKLIQVYFGLTLENPGNGRDLRQH